MTKPRQPGGWRGFRNASDRGCLAAASIDFHWGGDVGRRYEMNTENPGDGQSDICKLQTRRPAMGSTWRDPFRDLVGPAGHRLDLLLDLIAEAERCRQPGALLKLARFALRSARTSIARAAADHGDPYRYCPHLAALRWARLLLDLVDSLRCELRRDSWALSARTGCRRQPTTVEAAADRLLDAVLWLCREADAIDRARFFGEPAAADHGDGAAAALEMFEDELAEIRRLLGPRGEFRLEPALETAK